MNQALRITIPSFILLYILLKKLDFMRFQKNSVLLPHQFRTNLVWKYVILRGVSYRTG